MLIFRDLLFFSLCVEVFTFELPNHYDYRTSEALIFEHCKKDYETILIKDDSKQLSPTWLEQLHKQFHSIILYQKSLRCHRKCFNKKRVDAILIVASSLSRLSEILQPMNTTMWWNVMIPVYLLHLPDNDCEVAMRIFEHMWDRKIVTSYFLCIRSNKVQIYTYNPFTNRAPNEWRKVRRSPTLPRWTLYQRKYQAGSICQGLDFDRTKYLDGHQITAIAPLNNEKRSLLESNFIQYNDMTRYRFMMKALTLTLRLRIRLYIYHDVRLEGTKVIKTIGNITREISPNLVLADYYMQSKTVLNNKAFTLTYPLAWYVNGIATLNRGYRTLGEKVWDFYGIWTILFTIFVLLVTFAVIWFSERRKTAFAVFEIIRLLISQSLYTRMNTLSLRIFFITILIYSLIIQATFIGHLAKFLTKPQLRKQVETQEDLKLLGYTKIYNESRFYQISRSVKQRYNTFLQARYCMNHFLHNDTSACVFDHLMLLEHARRTENLYVSQKPIEVQYTGFPVSNRWPLLNRVNWFFMLLEDLGFRQWLSKKDSKRYSEESQNMVKTTSNDDFYPIKLENLIFIFWILAVGLTSAAVSFCVEMFIYHKSKLNLISRMKNVKKKTITKRGVLVRPERSTRLTSQ